jgi:hypothetical protein
LRKCDEAIAHRGVFEVRRAEGHVELAERDAGLFDDLGLNGVALPLPEDPAIDHEGAQPELVIRSVEGDRGSDVDPVAELQRGVELDRADVKAILVEPRELVEKVAEGRKLEGQ